MRKDILNSYTVKDFPQRLCVIIDIMSMELESQISEMALPFGDKKDLDPLLDFIGNSRFVLLGESTHGTHEFYFWRAEITKRLILEKGFSFVAVEGDWPDCYEINRYIKGYSNSAQSAIESLHIFSRWPTWMWANWETEELIQWLKLFNDELPDQKKIGFYGLDVYSLWDSLAEIILYLQEYDPNSVETALRAFRCFGANQPSLVSDNCRNEVVGLLTKIKERNVEYRGDFEEYFNVEQNALVAKNAEAYYRTMTSGGVDSWNIRDTHMAETLERLNELHGLDSKAIIWAHNTHVGDAIYTDMAEIGEINIGQIIRYRHEKEGVVLVGFDTYQGEVIAGRSWEGVMEKMIVPPAVPGSWDALFHQAVGKDTLYLFGEKEKESKELSQPQGLRAIGVVYNPDDELFNYVPTFLSKRFDSFIFLNTTSALQPLPVATEFDVDYPQTYPTTV